MRLSVTALLVTLALCYYEANAVVCPIFAMDVIEYLYVPDTLYRLTLVKYNAPPEAVAAKMKVKQCINELADRDVFLITKILKRILEDCIVADIKSLTDPSSA